MYEYRNPYILDFRNVQYYGEVHKIIKEAFDFPDYYGENWSAFWDCLTDLVGPEPFCVKVFGFATIRKKMPETAKQIESIFDDIRMYYDGKYADNILIEYIS